MLLHKLIILLNKSHFYAGELEIRPTKQTCSDITYWSKDTVNTVYM